MSERVTIKAEPRQETGKGVSRKLRKQGLIPANVIGKESVMISLDPKWLSKAWKADKTFEMELSGATRTVKIQELQIHPVKRTAVHVDLMYA
jgi:large subunit ribosomal protein L25